MVNGYSLRAFHLAGPGVGATSETKFFHLGNHVLCPSGSLRTSLRKQSEGTDPCGDEQHSRSVLASGYASSATNASGGIHTLLSVLVRNENSVSVLRRTCTDRDESSSLKNLVKGAAIHNQVFDYRESRASERLNCDGGSVLEMTHEKLASGHMIIRTVGAAVNIQ